MVLQFYSSNWSTIQEQIKVRKHVVMCMNNVDVLSLPSSDQLSVNFCLILNKHSYNKETVGILAVG